MKRLRFWMEITLIFGGLFFFTMAGYSTAQTHFDAAADFSIISNPNGVWSYGYSSVPNGSLDTLFAENEFDGFAGVPGIES